MIVLVAVPLLPLTATAAIVLLRPSGDTAARWAVRSGALAAIAAIALAALAVGGSVEAIAENGDGRAIVGLVADRVTAVLAVLTAGVGLVVQSFARRALAGDPRAARFFALASLLTASTAFMAMAATGTGLALGWIVAGTSLSGLVAHRAGWEPAARASRRVRRSFTVGDLALVVALALTAAIAGDPDLRRMDDAAATLARFDAPLLGTGGALAAVAALLVVAGVSRSAIIPFHRWLPATLAGPTPASALLHAGVVNGAGVLLVRFAPVFGASPVATHLAFALGAVTVVIATGVMLVRADVKGNLVWSTAGQMGFMVVQCAVGAFSAALFHLVGHGMYKAALFLGSGGAITAHLGRRHTPQADPGISSARRGLVAFAVPPMALAVAYAVVDPGLDAAGDILVVAFAWATGTRALRGWLDAAPLRTPATIATGTAATVLSSFVYVGGLAAFKGFVAPALPTTVPASVSPTVLAATLAVIAIAFAITRVLPDRTGSAVRLRVYTALLAIGTPVERYGPTPRGSASETGATPVARTLPATPHEPTLPRSAGGAGHPEEIRG